MPTTDDTTSPRIFTVTLEDQGFANPDRLTPQRVRFHPVSRDSGRCESAVWINGGRTRRCRNTATMTAEGKRVCTRHGRGD